MRVRRQLRRPVRLIMAGNEIGKGGADHELVNLLSGLFCDRPGAERAVVSDGRRALASPLPFSSAAWRAGARGAAGRGGSRRTRGWREDRGGRRTDFAVQLFYVLGISRLVWRHGLSADALLRCVVLVGPRLCHSERPCGGSSRLRIPFENSCFP